jgi:hypothetical protein
MDNQWETRMQTHLQVNTKVGIRAMMMAQAKNQSTTAQGGQSGRVSSSCQRRCFRF